MEVSDYPPRLFSMNFFIYKLYLCIFLNILHILCDNKRAKRIPNRILIACSGNSYSDCILYMMWHVFHCFITFLNVQFHEIFFLFFLFLNNDCIVYTIKILQKDYVVLQYISNYILLTKHLRLLSTQHLYSSENPFAKSIQIKRYIIGIFIFIFIVSRYM